MSAVKQTTFTPFSVSHLVTVQESRPPDAANATVWPFRSATVVMVFLAGLRWIGLRTALRCTQGFHASLHAPRDFRSGSRGVDRTRARSRAARMLRLTRGTRHRWRRR